MASVDSSCWIRWLVVLIDQKLLKANLLWHYLGGTAERSCHKQLEKWWQQQPTLQHVMKRSHQAFRTTINQAQATKVLTSRKIEAVLSWTFFVYLVAVSDVTGGAEALVLKNIVHYASTDLRHVLTAK